MVNVFIAFSPFVFFDRIIIQKIDFFRFPFLKLLQIVFQEKQKREGIRKMGFN